MEIERKFRLTSLPILAILRTGTSAEIAQGYLFTDGGEMRIRRKGIRYFLTVKGEGNLAREEWEAEVPEWVFVTLWGKTEGRRVEKTRYAIPCQGNTLEVDKYFGHLAGLFTLEVEFADEAAAAAFQLPDWAEGAVDVTADKRYKNKALSTAGGPPTD